MKTPFVNIPPNRAKELFECLAPLVAEYGELSKLSREKYYEISAEIDSKISAILLAPSEPESSVDIEKSLAEVMLLGRKGFAFFRGFQLEAEQDLPKTPSRIFDVAPPHIGEYILAGLLGRFDHDDKKLSANLVRPESKLHAGKIKAEPFHSHPESRCAAFFFNRGDKNAVTKILPAENIFSNADENLKSALLEPLLYIPGEKKLPFIILQNDGTPYFHPLIAEQHNFKRFCVDLEQKSQSKNLTFVAGYALECLENEDLVFEHTAKAGDLFIVDPLHNIRSSPAYEPENSKGRWADFLAVPRKASHIDQFTNYAPQDFSGR